MIDTCRPLRVVVAAAAVVVLVVVDHREDAG